AMDWRAFVESLSIVEQILRGNPAEDVGFADESSREYQAILKEVRGYSDIYGEMDFATRDRYRHIVEQIAKSSKVPEWDVATHAVQLARRAGDAVGHLNRTAHVG